MVSSPGPQPQDFPTRQLVMVDTRNLGRDEKYSDNFPSPFPVLNMRESPAYTLQLLEGWKINHVFHEM